MNEERDCDTPCRERAEACRRYGRVGPEAPLAARGELGLLEDGNKSNMAREKGKSRGETNGAYISDDLFKASRDRLASRSTLHEGRC